MSDLWTLAAQRTAAALASGALEPLETSQIEVMDQGVRFGIRALSSLRRKARRGPRPANPFLPPDPELTVCPWGETHTLILNKFPIFADHLLLITRAFATQQAPLEPSDWRAALDLLAAADGLLFYNGGADAGASQPHRHLQLVRAPIGPGDDAFPTEPVIDTGALGVALAGADLPEDPERAYHVYQTLHAELGLGDGDPYNLLATRRRLWLIPRRTEHFEGVSVNALGFAGSLLVKTEEEALRLAARGPLRALQQTGAPAAR